MSQSKKTEEYIGDGVYVTWDGWYITLDLRMQGSERIAMEPNVLSALLRFVERTKEGDDSATSDGRR